MDYLGIEEEKDPDKEASSVEEMLLLAIKECFLPELDNLASSQRLKNADLAFRVIEPLMIEFEDFLPEFVNRNDWQKIVHPLFHTFYALLHACRRAFLEDCFLSLADNNFVLRHILFLLKHIEETLGVEFSTRYGQ